MLNIIIKSTSNLLIEYYITNLVSLNVTVNNINNMNKEYTLIALSKDRGFFKHATHSFITFQL